MNNNPISADGLENDLSGFSVFGAVSAKTGVPVPDNNGNTSNTKKTSKRRKPGNAGTMRNTARQRQSKSGKNGKTDKFVPKTYKFPPELIELVNRVAYWQRRHMQDIIAEALLKYFETVPEEDKAEIKRKH